MNNEINIEVKEHYGTQHIYVISEHNEAIQQLTGRKTITKSDIVALKKLGYTFKQALIEV